MFSNTTIEEHNEQNEEADVSKPHSSANILIELVKQNKELMSSNQEFKELMVEQQKEKTKNYKNNYSKV